DAGLTAEARAGRRGGVGWGVGFTPPDLTLAISDFTRSYAAALFPKTPCERGPTPVEYRPPAGKIEARDFIREELATPSADVVIVQVSRLVEYKGQRLLLEALADLRDVPGWTGWFVGGPQTSAEHRYLAELKSKAAELEIAERVRFVGARADVPRLLAAA